MPLRRSCPISISIPVTSPKSSASLGRALIGSGPRWQHSLAQHDGFFFYLLGFDGAAFFFAAARAAAAFFDKDFAPQIKPGDDEHRQQNTPFGPTEGCFVAQVDGWLHGVCLFNSMMELGLEAGARWRVGRLSKSPNQRQPAVQGCAIRKQAGKPFNTSICNPLAGRAYGRVLQLYCLLPSCLVRLGHGHELRLWRGLLGTRVA